MLNFIIIWMHRFIAFKSIYFIVLFWKYVFGLAYLDLVVADCFHQISVGTLPLELRSIFIGFIFLYLTRCIEELLALCFILVVLKDVLSLNHILRLFCLNSLLFEIHNRFFNQISLVFFLNFDLRSFLIIRFVLSSTLDSALAIQTWFLKHISMYLNTTHVSTRFVMLAFHT